MNVDCAAGSILDEPALFCGVICIHTVPLFANYPPGVHTYSVQICMRKPVFRMIGQQRSVLEVVATVVTQRKPTR